MQTVSWEHCGSLLLSGSGWVRVNLVIVYRLAGDTLRFMILLPLNACAAAACEGAV